MDGLKIILINLFQYVFIFLNLIAHINGKIPNGKILKKIMNHFYNIIKIIIVKYVQRKFQ